MEKARKAYFVPKTVAPTRAGTERLRAQFAQAVQRVFQQVPSAPRIRSPKG